MSYVLKWEPHGVVKYFTGTVTSRDLMESEQELVNHPRFDRLRYVISVYLTAVEISFSENDREEMIALRVGGFQTNRRVRYAIVAQDERIRQSVLKSIATEETRHKTALFGDLMEAIIWANDPSPGE